MSEVLHFATHLVLVMVSDDEAAELLMMRSCLCSSMRPSDSGEPGEKEAMQEHMGECRFEPHGCHDGIGDGITSRGMHMAI